ncbi:MAG: hypothetical protein ACI9YH_001554 [Colwellia sp.]|jgi:hypothetical protein
MTKQVKDSASLLMKAFDKAASVLELSISEKSKILGIHPSTFVCNLNKGYPPQSKIGQRQLHFIQLYKVLYQICAGDKALMHHWYNCDNKALNDAPKVLCRSMNGMFRVTQYLQSLHPKILNL